MKGKPRAVLERHALDADPVAQFGKWYRDAREGTDLSLPGACCLSTVGEDGYPEGRMVLLKGFDERGFVFYTNLKSAKAASLERRPRAALTFYWEPLRRQVRIQGDVESVAAEEADAYFDTRPRGSQIGAWASDQSSTVEDRRSLDRRFREVRERFESSESVPRPPFWGGFRIRPRTVEFWQEAPDRMHDRFRYERADGEWRIVRLWP